MIWGRKKKRDQVAQAELLRQKELAEKKEQQETINAHTAKELEPRPREDVAPEDKKGEKKAAKKAEFEVLIKRWDIFLSRMKERYYESILDADEAVLDHLRDRSYSHQEASSFYDSLETQLEELIEKIEKTWKKQVKKQMKPVSKEKALRVEEKKGKRLVKELETHLEEHTYAIMGQVGQEIYTKAIDRVHQNFTCSQCHAQVEIDKNVFRAQYVTCQYCTSVNTYEPDEQMRDIEENAIPNITRSTCRAQELEMEKEIERFHIAELPGSSEKTYKKYQKKYLRAKEAILQYHSAYADERARLFPNFRDQKEEYVKEQWADFKKENARLINELNHEDQ